VSLKCCN